ncbi:MAG: OadG family protein [Clostridia bacterium]
MDKLMFGLSVSGIGLLVVFAGLILLIFCIQAITKIATAGEKKKTAKETVAAAPAPVAAPAVAVSPAVTEGIPADVIAAITAAVAAVWQGEQGFVVRHVKRVQNAPVWNRAGREEQTYSRF